MRIPDTLCRRISGALLAGGVLLALTASPGLSAQDVDSRWLPWLGCWQAAEAVAEAPLLCVRPLTESPGVELITWSDGKITSSEAILADGLPRDSNREGCQGLEQAEFSGDGQRVYLKSQYVCEGGVERDITGILAMVNPMEWVDIKVVDGQGQQVPWVMRYRLARATLVEAAGLAEVVQPRAEAVKAARIAASARLTDQDLAEAAAKVAPEALEALIVERKDRFAVNAESLVRMADAGVPPSVIDVVVAVSFPDRFALGAGAVDEMPQTRRGYGAIPMRIAGGYYGGGFWNPYFYNPFYHGYGAYGYSPFGYGGYGWGGYYYRPTPITVQPRGGFGGTAGRMVKGRGYTRGGSSGSSVPSTRSGGGSASGGSGSGVSSGGSRSGGRSSGGRTAVRKGGGGGT